MIINSRIIKPNRPPAASIQVKKAKFKPTKLRINDRNPVPASRKPTKVTHPLFLPMIPFFVWTTLSVGKSFPIQIYPKIAQKYSIFEENWMVQLDVI